MAAPAGVFARGCFIAALVRFPKTVDGLTGLQKLFSNLVMLM